MLYQTDFEQKKKSCIKIFSQNVSICNNQGKDQYKGHHSMVVMHLYC